MSTYQMLIAVAFNEKMQYTYKELIDSTHIPEPDFKCHLIPFLSLKIITKNPATREFLLTDQFTINNSFKSNHVRIKMPISQMKENKK